MQKYNTINKLNKLKNFISEGGIRTKRLSNNNKKKPLISIITVVKNSKKNIEKTIKSIINQPLHNIEYIIIDGNSCDGTINKIKKYENKIEYWCSIKDQGIYDAMNYGLKLANGEIIGICNAGDIYTKNALGLVKKYFKDNKNLSYLFGTVKRYYLGNNMLIKSGFSKKRILYNFDAQTCHSSGFFIKSNIQKKIGLYNLKYICSSDYDLFFKLFKNNKFIGKSTQKKEIVGIVAKGGFSSRYGFWSHLFEESKIRIDNKQNIFFVTIIFLNIVIKKLLKKIL